MYSAAQDGRVEDVEEILRRNPAINVNWKNELENDKTALMVACFQGFDSIVSILLAYPGIDVNLKHKQDGPPFIMLVPMDPPPVFVRC